MEATMSLSRSGTITNLVLAKDITTFIECLAFRTYCSNHRALVAVVEATHRGNDKTACLAAGCLHFHCSMGCPLLPLQKDSLHPFFNNVRQHNAAPTLK